MQIRKNWSNVYERSEIRWCSAYRENLNCVYQAEDVGKMDTFWQEQMSEPAVKNMLEQPRKTYITRLDKEGKNYDFAVVSRTDGKGLVAAYIEKTWKTTVIFPSTRCLPDLHLI